jgi:hypothetical protein
MDELIPSDVQQFILKRIDSIAELEAMLLLSGHPEQAWRTPDVARRLYVNEQETATVLARLQGEGLVVVQPGDPPTYRYQPITPELEEIARRVLDSYQKHLVPVTNLVHSKPRTRIQEFADAFKLRKDEPRKDD